LRCVELQRKCKETLCHEDFYNGNQKKRIRREEQKKNEWMDGVRRGTNKHGLIKEDAKNTVKRFGRRKILHSGHNLI